LRVHTHQFDSFDQVNQDSITKAAAKACTVFPQASSVGFISLMMLLAVLPHISPDILQDGGLKAFGLK